MNRFSLFLFFCLLANITTITNAKDFNSYKAGFYDRETTASINDNAPSAVSATITGTTSVCINTTNPVITLSGSGGTGPYTFTYNINGGSDITVSSVIGNDNVALNVLTNAPGIFVYTLTNVTDANSDSQPQNGQAIVTVNALPVFDFTFTDNQCSGTGFQFTPSLTGNYSYAWDFGDGGTSTDASPTHLYTGSGNGTQNYFVRLTITDNSTTCQNTVTKSISTNKLPNDSISGSGSGVIVNGFPAFRICGNGISSFTFSNASTTAATNQHYNIDWGDGTTVFDTNTWTTTTHDYPIGLWKLTYTVQGSGGCINVKTYYVFVGSNPAVALGNPGSTNICITQTLTFPITGTDNNPNGTTYTVSYNDGSPDVVYTHPAPKTVTHKFLKTSCGTSSSDGSTTYPNAFFAKVVANNVCGTSASTITPIYVSTPPTPNFTVPSNKVCTNNQICFTNSSTNANTINGDICTNNANLIWRITPATGFTLSSGSYGNDFGKTDPSVWSSGSNSICPVFTKPGSYTITLKIGNRCDIDSISKTICVEAPLIPQFALSSTQGCAPFNVATTNKTDTTNSCSPTYKWAVTYAANYCGNKSAYTFTSGTSSTSTSPTFQFTNPGIYSIQLIATNSCGAVSAPVQTVTVTKPPTVTLNPIPDQCGTASLNPTAIVTSCAPATSTLTYTWSFPGGNPSSSAVLIPGTVIYNTVGNYTVSLVVTNECGISTNASQTFAVKPVPALTNTVLAQTMCSGFKADSVVLTSNLPNTTYSWTATATTGITGFISSGTSGKIPSTIILNSSNAPGTVTYTVIPSLAGCVGTAVNYVITVNPSPVITNQPQSVQVCQGGTTTPLTVVTANGLGVPTYQWYRNIINNNKTGTAIPGETNSTYNPPIGVVDTIYYYCRITFSLGGCSDLISNTAAVSVNPIPVIKSQPTPSQSICVGGTTSAPLNIGYNGGAGLATIQWYTNNTNTTTGGTIIPGATLLNYTPPAFAATGTFYFYAQISFAGSACGSVVSDTARVIVVADPVVTAQPLSTQTLCQNVIPADLTVTASGGIGVYSYQWYSNPVNNNSTGTKIINATGSSFTPPTSKAGTTYYYCVISQPQGPGCGVTSSTSQVIVDATPVFSTQPLSSAVCLGGIPSVLTVTTINGTGAPQYQWYSNRNDSINGGTPIPGAISSTYTPPAGTVGTTYYYCTATFSTGGCSALISDIARVTINAFPSISTYSISVSSGNPFTISPNNLNGDVVPAGTTYTWTVPVINPAGSVTGASSQSTPQPDISQVLTNLTTGNATVTYTVTPTSGTCKGTDFKVIVTVNSPVYPGIVLKNISCFGANDGSIQTNITGGVPFKTGNPYLISWAGSNGFTSGNTTISNLNPGDYLLTIKDSVGFTFSKSYTILEPQVINIQTLTSTNITCNGSANGEIAIVATGGTPPYAYSWIKDGVPFPGLADIKNLNPGNYTVTVTDANNCIPKMASFTIIEPIAIDITPVSQVNLTCFGDTNGSVSVSVSGGVPFEKTPGVFSYTYSWSGPNGFSANTKDLTNIAAGTYNLTVTDNSGCTRTFTANVTQPAQIKITPVVTPVTCFGANDASISLVISGGIPPYGIQWSNLGKGTIQDNLSPGTYTITVTDSLGCIMSKDILIAEAAFSIQPVVRQITCFGANDGSINLNIQGGIPPIKLSWADNPTAGNTRNRLGPGTYTASLSDASSCSFTKSFTIIEPVELKLFANITNAFDCNNPNSGAINLTVSGGTEPYSIAWTNGKTSTNLTGIQGGEYGVTVTDANGCSVDSVFEVVQPLPISLSVNTTPDFNCQTSVLNEICTAKVTGGIPPYMFTWSSGTVTGLNNETMETTQPGFIVLSVTDGKNCTASYTFNLAVPVPGIDDQVIDCNAHTFSFNAIIPNGLPSNYSFLWNFGDGKTETIQQPQHTFSTPGTYRVTLTMKSPTCTSVFEKDVTVDATPTLILDKLPVFCTGDSILLHVSGAATYRWSNGWTGDSLLIKLPGDYSVSGISQYGCTVTLPFKATNFDSFNYTIQTDKNDVTTADPTLKLWSESISYSDYFWDFGDNQSAEGNDQTHTFDVSKDGYYDVKLKVKNPNGCYEFATKRIWITDVSMGNVFSPNGDGIDDVFMKGFHIQVYNRNGILLYDGTGGWDGTYKGNKVSNDTYFYVLYLSGNSGVKTKSGFITVVR
jgi:gliding motility-associated-like protein